MWIITGLFAFIAIGALTERLVSAALRKRFPAPGKMMCICGEQVHVHVQGEQTHKTPTVVFLAGLGNSPLAFSWVINELKQDFQTLSFDRPGTGWSAVSVNQPHAERSADILAGVLQELNINAPVLLVGHSYGGIVARVFSCKYAIKVAGVVFVDSSHEDQIEQMPGLLQPIAKLMMKKAACQKWAAHIGLLRFPGAISGEGYGLPTDAQQAFNAVMASPKSRAACAAEARQWPKSQQQARNSRHLGNLPITVLATDQWPPAMQPIWQKLQQEIASWSSRSAFETLPGSNHVTIIYSQKYSKIVTQHILDLSENSIHAN